MTVSIPKKIGKRKTFEGQKSEGSTSVTAVPVPTEDKRKEIPVDPTLSKLAFIDWGDASVLRNEEAVRVLTELVGKCHPVVLKFLLDREVKRIVGDFSLWAIKREAKDMLDLWRVTYTEG